MINVHIDGALLSVPLNLANDADEFVILLRRIAYWARNAGSAALRLTRCSDIEDRLMAANAFPTFPAIDRAILDLGIGDQFSTRDIVTQINHILNKAAISSELIGDEVLDCAEFVMEPSTISDRYPIGIRNLTAQTFATAQCSNAGLFEKGINLVVHGVPDKVQGPILLKGVVSSTTNGSINCPTPIEGEVQPVEQFYGPEYVIDAESVWSNATSDAEYHLAIGLRAAEIAKKYGAPLGVHELKSFSLGGGFVSSLYETQSSAAMPYADVVLDTCARVILGIPKNPISYFGGSRRNGDDGFRTQVRKGNPALRLMFWQGASGIEFANIGMKKDLEILDDPRRSAFQASFVDFQSEVSF